jgi:murein DD-endopeptidase MepM/ murein hydrolase activator NlpD
MSRPIPNGYVDYTDRTYAYGSTAGGTYRPHTGEEFRNPEGTPVVAVADGTIQYAGDDIAAIYGPTPNFYGNLIVLALNGVTYQGKQVYGVYGHVSKIDVKSGDAVASGQKIGEVGQTGIAIGPHLHFEVRVGDVGGAPRIPFHFHMRPGRGRSFDFKRIAEFGGRFDFRRAGLEGFVHGSTFGNSGRKRDPRERGIE